LIAIVGLFLGVFSLLWYYFIIQPNAMEVKDSNGNLLVAGDSVVIIKDLPVK
jgi:hypothetical protein